MVFRKEKEMILNYVKTFLSEITKGLLSDEIEVVKKQIKALSTAVIIIIMVLWIILIMNVVILIKVA